MEVRSFYSGTSRKSRFVPQDGNESDNGMDSEEDGEIVLNSDFSSDESDQELDSTNIEDSLEKKMFYLESFSCSEKKYIVLSNFF